MEIVYKLTKRWVGTMLSVYGNRRRRARRAPRLSFALVSASTISRHETYHSSEWFIACCLIMLWTLSLFNKTGNCTSALTIKAWASWPKSDMKLRWKFREMFSFRSPSTLTPEKLRQNNAEWRVFFISNLRLVVIIKKDYKQHTDFFLLLFSTTWS